MIKHLFTAHPIKITKIIVLLLFCTGIALSIKAVPSKGNFTTNICPTNTISLHLLPDKIEENDQVSSVKTKALWLASLCIIAFLSAFLIKSERKRKCIQRQQPKQGDDLFSSKLLEALQTNVVFFDANGSVRYANALACNNLQIEQKNLINKNITEIFVILHENKNILTDLISQLQQRNEDKIKLPENTFIQTSNSVRFLARGQFMLLDKGEILFSFQNIVEELTQKYIFDMALSNTKIFPWYFDIQTSTMTIDARYFTYTGIPTQDNTMTLNEFIDRIHPDDRENLISAFQKQLTGNLYSDPVSFRLRRGDDAYEWFEGQSVYLGEVNESPFRLVGICMSTQAHKDTEAALIQARDKAEQSDRLKSAFLANMSHEIRTPLNAIVGFSDLLINSENESEKTEYNQIITTNTELLLRLIDDILNLSKIEAGFIDRKPELFDLSLYFNELYISAQQRMKNPNVELICDNPYPHCIVYLDKERLAQVMLNYITNAIKYTPRGTIRMGYKYENKGIRLYVSDTGIGVSEEKKQKVYQRFEKLDEFAQGTGLGLSICKALTESAEGYVDFESKEGVGSTFWSWLPCEVTFPEETDQNKETEIPVSSRQIPASDSISNNTLKKILIAEDIESNYQLIAAILRKKYNLIWVKDGSDAVEKVHSEIFHLILMDMKMPKMNGLEATAKIREFDKTTPIIALTAHAFDTYKEEALASGCNDYLVKPVNKDLLLDTIVRWTS